MKEQPLVECPTIKKDFFVVVVVVAVVLLFKGSILL